MADTSAPAIRNANRRRIVANAFMDGIATQMVHRRGPALPSEGYAALDGKLILATDCFRAAEKIHEHYLSETKARAAAGKRVY